MSHTSSTGITWAPTLPLLAEQAFERLGDFDALFFEGRWYRSGEMRDTSQRLSTGLRDLGVGPGDRVVVMMTNCPEVGISYGAITRAGAAAVPVMFLLPPADVARIISDCAPTAIIATSDILPSVLAARGETEIPVVVLGDMPPGPNLHAFADVASAAPSGIVDRAPDDLAVLMYTGGTTGRSKGVMLSHKNLVDGAGAARDVTYREGVGRSIVPLPLAHVFGVLTNTLGNMAEQPHGSVLMKWFEPVQWLQLAQDHQVQIGGVVPSMMSILLAQPLESYDLSHLTFLASGASALPHTVAEEIERRIPGVTVLEGYGCTETAAITTTHPPQDRRLGSVGISPPPHRIRLMRPETLDEVPTGADGEVCVSGPGVMLGYWQDPAATDAAIVTDADGVRWFRTGDIGVVDADGYLRIVDRLKDLIIRNGFNVYPRDVEDVLLEHDEVVGAIVVGRPDDRVGEEVVAFVAVRPGSAVTADDVLVFGREHLAGTKYPREVRLIDAIPLTAVGKPDRKKLRAVVVAEAA